MRVGQVRTVEPAVLPLSLNEAKAAARVDHTDEDTLIESLIQAATDLVEDRTGRALITQTWRFYTWGLYGDDAFQLPRLPVSAIAALEYRDSAGNLQSASVDDFRLTADGWRAQVEPIEGQQWPQAGDRADAIRITVTAGYGDGAESVPEPLRLAIRLLVGHWYEHRAAVIVGKAAVQIPLGVEHILQSHRTGWVQ